jgi:hypothetical protein
MSTLRCEGPVPGEPFLMLGAFDLAASGYGSEEWRVSGRARRYAPRGALGPDGDWRARPESEADFTTRVVLRRPLDPADFDGTVYVEWLNVSGGLDAPPGWLFAHRHVMRRGSVWVGVSAQKAGIDGGGLVPGMPLKQADPERYGGLDHPGDAFAYDIFAAVGRSLREREGPLAGLAVRRVIALGESQSAGFLVTYVNALDPVDRCFDAFLIHGRPGSAAGLDGVYLRSAPGGDLSNVSRLVREAHRVRPEPRVPVLVLQSETDVVSLGGGRARQPDGENLRLWEVAGAAHFDSYGLVASLFDDGRLPIEQLAAHLAPTDAPMGLRAREPINAGPQQHYLVQSALHHLDRQLRGGPPPPRVPRIESEDEAGSALLHDAWGIARGGLRTPWVDAPSARLSGLGQGGEGFLFLFGTTHVFDEATLARLYPGGPDEHRERFEKSLSACLAAGTLLAEDADEIRALVRCGRQVSGWQA